MARRLRLVAIVLAVIVRLEEIVADAADVRAAAGEIVDAAGAVDVPVAAVGIADAAGRAGEDTRTFCHGFARIHTDRKEATARVVAFSFSGWFREGHDLGRVRYVLRIESHFSAWNTCRLEEHGWRYIKFLAQPANMLLGQFTLATQHLGRDAFGAEDIEQVLLSEVMRFH
jgi:hypothetical protein